MEGRIAFFSVRNQTEEPVPITVRIYEPDQPDTPQRTDDYTLPPNRLHPSTYAR